MKNQKNRKTVEDSSSKSREPKTRITINPGPKRDEFQVLPDTFFNNLNEDTFPRK